MEAINSAADKIVGAAKGDLIQNIIRDLKSMRAMWSWAYLSLYVWVCVWALRHRPQAAQTVVTVTGGLAGSIFTGYVFSKTFEKHHKLGQYGPQPERVGGPQ